jgi:hypothetical protein
MLCYDSHYILGMLIAKIFFTENLMGHRKIANLLPGGLFKIFRNLVTYLFDFDH